MRKDIREEEEDLEVKEPVKKPRLKRASKPKKIQEIHYEEPQEVIKTTTTKKVKCLLMI